eukprot:m.790454 g.790454  ORF g.790454 m.790454 type:complete len:574 (-) comp59202_c1_seq10:90-1811(-)
MLLRALVVAALCGVALCHEHSVYWSLFQNPDTHIFEMVPRSNGDKPFLAGEVVFGGFNDTLKHNGWNTLEVHGNPDFDDETMAEGAGYLEGYLTSTQIDDYAWNQKVKDYLPSPTLAEFFTNNTEFTRSNLQRSRNFPPGNATRAYWWHVHLVGKQLVGLHQGYSNISDTHYVTVEDILFLNMQSEIPTLIDIYGGSQPGFVPKQNENSWSRDQHCSGLLRLLENNSDIFIAQTTWDTLNTMTRIFKLYDLPFTIDGDHHAGSERVPAVRSSFSSYPATLFSTDDYYVQSSGLVVLETSIGYWNNSLNSYIVSDTVFEYVRNIIANRLANSSPSWSHLFGLHNSGTYCNQFMTFDYKLFTPGQPLLPDTFWLLEQLPGFIVAKDLSALLQTQGYFASYNQIYDEFLRFISGTVRMEHKYGYYYNYNFAPRGQIFARDIPNVVDLESMMAIMRYNNYTEDPLSSQMPFCQFRNRTDCHPPYSAALAIADRSDLNPLDGVWAFSDLSAVQMAALDCKISSFSSYDNSSLLSYAQSGPSYDTQPVFVFSESAYSQTRRRGLPDRWEFPWVTFQWEH